MNITMNRILITTLLLNAVFAESAINNAHAVYLVPEAIRPASCITPLTLKPIGRNCITPAVLLKIAEEDQPDQEHDATEGAEQARQSHNFVTEVTATGTLKRSSAFTMLPPKLPVPPIYKIQLYYISAYDALDLHTVEDRYIMCQGHKKYKYTPLSPVIDENWRSVCNIYQSVYRRNNDTILKATFNEDFTKKCDFIGEVLRREDKYSDAESVFYFLKQVAWVHPAGASFLVRSLQKGVTDPINPKVYMIPSRPEWIPYWQNRYDCLMQDGGYWYIPKKTKD